MSLKCSFLLLLIACEGIILPAQTVEEHILAFHFTMGNSALQLNNPHYQPGDDSIQIELLRFYVSGIELLNNNKTIFKEKNSFHLIDASENRSLLIPLNTAPNITFNRIKFNLGIDSVTNVSGAMGGDLDPTLGMYWTWQSGYINFKLEGKSNRCKTRNNEFQFHLGGYQSPFSALQTVILNTAATKKINIVLNMEKVIGDVDMVSQNHIMSPGKDAVSLSEKVSTNFSIQQK